MATAGENPAAAISWLDLSNHLGEKILERLPVADYLIFAAVCRQWRSIQSNRRRRAPLPPPMVSRPWFIPQILKGESVLCSDCLPSDYERLDGERRSIRVKVPFSDRYLERLRGKRGGEERQSGSRVCRFTLLNGWLLLEDEPVWSDKPDETRGAIRYLTLVNPLVGSQIKLPGVNCGKTRLSFAAASYTAADVAVLLWRMEENLLGVSLWLFRASDKDHSGYYPADWERVYYEDINHCSLALTSPIFF